MSKASIVDARLYGIVDFGYVSAETAAETTVNLVEGGADLVQLRAKGVSRNLITKAAREIAGVCKAMGVPLIINDFPEIAVEIGADGVHLGQEDGEIDDVRRMTGKNMLIGRSTHSLIQAGEALRDGADYIGFGPLYPTPTKQGRPAIGLNEIAAMETEVGSRIPAFCIGGIQPGNLAKVIEAGATRVVVVSHLLLAADTRAATEEIKSRLTHGRL